MSTTSERNGAEGRTLPCRAELLRQIVSVATLEPAAQVLAKQRPAR